MQLPPHMTSIPLRPRQLVGVEIAVAEQLLADPRPLHEEADVELIGHAHAAMHMHALLDRQRRRRTRTRLCHRHRPARLFKIRIQHLQRLQYRGAVYLDLDINLRRAVLQRLEFADGLAELLALLEVADGSPEHPLGYPDHFGGDRPAADIEHAFQQCPALIDFAEYPIGVDFDVIELDPRGVVRIDHRGALNLDAFGPGIDQE